MESITLNATLVTAIVSVFLPFVTGFVTKLRANTTIKQVVSIVVAAATGLIVTSTQLDGTAVISKEAALLVAISLGVEVLTYLGFIKPNPVLPNSIAPDFGIG